MGIQIKGIVQGVGFRPFIYNLARKFGLCGYVLNNTQGVEIEAEGEKSDLDQFLVQIKNNHPPQSKIEMIEVKDVPPRSYQNFTIRESESEDKKTALVSPDLATCQDCLSEVFDPRDRRFNYPFLNCTNCGPRLTIIQDVPYDRKNTTMDVFKMCPECDREYHNPENRRFHAQPNACPNCGPTLILLDNKKNLLNSANPIDSTIDLLKRGFIVAIKGIGGYHLACDATNEAAVKNLRKRKYREDKPFALMAKDLPTIQEFCWVNPFERKLLQSVFCPIVLLKKNDTDLIAPDVAPLQKNWGVMLPYSPLHHLLLNKSDMILVMTSGNQSDEPIAYEEDDAFCRLSHIADYFLAHNREIFRRCDDSVNRVWKDQELILRRARGYVPQPIKVNFSFRRNILATGAQLKNTFCLARDDSAFLSTHIGDLENFETLDFYIKEIQRFKSLCAVKPEVIAFDLHPEYLSTKYALSLDDVEKIQVQHHHAHIASCMAENQINEMVIGVAFDGTGYGDDKAIWGGEFLITDMKDYHREAHFDYVLMPGGEMAIKQPWRMALSYLYNLYEENFLNLDLEFIKRIDQEKWNTIKKILDRKINVFPSSSVGRLFDCVSILLNWRENTNYEGQPAVELEFLADENVKGFYDFEITKEQDKFIIHPDLIIKGVVGDLIEQEKKSTISARFHNTMAQVINQVCLKLRREHNLNVVCLSGGVFQNMFLLEGAFELLTRNKFKVYTHNKVPPNDGGISLGQAAVVNQRI